MVDTPTKPASNGGGSGLQRKFGMLFLEEKGINVRHAQPELS